MNSFTRWRGGKGLAAACAVAALVGAKPQAAGGEATVLAGRTMGTTYQVRYWGAGEATPAEMAAAIEKLLATFDEQMSTYREDSEVSRFNQAPADEWFAVSPDTAKVVAASLDFHRDTGGVLDVTVGPVLRAWNLGPGSDRRRELAQPPAEAELEKALATVGSKHLAVRDEPPALRKDLAGVEVELSSIAPGYAVDLLVELLERHGFANVMVELGGEVRACGRRTDGQPWRIGVESPVGDGGSLARIVPLADLALSTAGDYRILRTADGRRYTHIVDPRTGQALAHRGSAVTVLADTCLTADALDTPLLVMGAEAGARWCVERNVAAMFQTLDEAGGVAVQTTPRFDELAARSGEPNAD